jgi:hypothetical protein
MVIVKPTLRDRILKAFEKSGTLTAKALASFGPLDEVLGELQSLQWWGYIKPGANRAYTLISRSPPLLRLWAKIYMSDAPGMLQVGWAGPEWGELRRTDALDAKLRTLGVVTLNQVYLKDCRHEPSGQMIGWSPEHDPMEYPQT